MGENSKRQPKTTMKTKTKLKSAVYPIAILAMSIANGQAEPDPSDRPGSVVELHGQSEATEASIRAELRALEAASNQKRDQLRARLIELHLEEMREREAKPREVAGDDVPHMAFLGAPVPEHLTDSRWMIGVAVLRHGEDGVTVGGVTSGSPAAEAGIEDGDVIEAVNGIRIKELRGLRQIIDAAGDQELSFAVRRGDKVIKTNLTPAEAAGDEGTPGVVAFSTRAGTVAADGDMPRALLRRLEVPREASDDELRFYEWMRKSESGAQDVQRDELEELKGEVQALRALIEKIAGELDEDGDEG